MRMWTVILFVAASTAYSSARYPQFQFHKHPSYGNQRIIKIHGSPVMNRFHGHHQKPIRNRPVPGGGLPKGYYHHSKEEFFRPNHPSSFPEFSYSPFFNGPNSNHVKHLQRPPPLPQQIQLKLPSYGSGFPYKNLNNFRTSTSKPVFRKQKPVLTGPIAIQQVEQVSHLPQISHSQQQPQQVSQVSQVTPVPQVPAEKEETATASASHQFPSFAEFPYSSPSPASQIVFSSDDNGPIKEVPAPNLGPKPAGGYLESGGLASSVRNSGAETSPALLDLTNFLKEPVESSSPGKNQFVQIPDYHQNQEKYQVSGYEVTESHELQGSNDQIIKGHDGTKVYYAPDPDPSLPVYKVPPTSDPHSTPSNGQNLNDLYVPQAFNGFTLPQGDSAGQTIAPLSPQELHRLLQGYPTVLSHPLVTHLRHSQADNVLLSGSGQNYYRPGADDSAEVSDIFQYLQNPQIHNLIHNSPNHGPETISSSSASVYATGQLPEFAYLPYEQYQSYLQSIYQPYHYPNSPASGGQNLDGSEGNPNPHYESETTQLETGQKYIRQIDQTSTGNVESKIKDLEDPAEEQTTGNEEQTTTEAPPEVYQFKIAPEVPVYSSLPNEKAAQTLAGLQAAGNVASDYLNRLKTPRGKNPPEEPETEEGKPKRKPNKDGKLGGFRFSRLRNSPKKEDPETEESGKENSTKLEFRESNDSNETFGKRLKPK